MIYDKVQHAARYKFSSAALNKALEHVASGSPADEEDSGFYISNIISFQTSVLESKQAEYHRKYIDIHVVLEGKEYVEVGHLDELTNSTSFDEKSDIGFGKLPEVNAFRGYLSPSFFLVCFPEDAHLVGAHIDEQEHVRKIVYKVPVE